MKYILLFLALASVRAVGQTKKPIYEPEPGTVLRDTVLKRVDYDTTLTAVYVIKCDTCEMQLMAAYKINRCQTETKFATTFYIKTGKPVLDLARLTGPGCPWNAELYKYLRYDKKPFSKSWTIIKEKEL